VACTGERRGAYRVLVGRPEGKKSLGRYSFDRSHPLVLYTDQVIYSVKTQHILSLLLLRAF
jgi:hypothetical protein